MTHDLRDLCLMALHAFKTFDALLPNFKDFLSEGKVVTALSPHEGFTYKVFKTQEG